MKKAITLVLEDDQIIELVRILLDHDSEAALVFLKQNIKGKALDLLEGG